MQIALCAEVDDTRRNGAGKGKKKAVAVDPVFFQRLSTILAMCGAPRCLLAFADILTPRYEAARLLRRYYCGLFFFVRCSCVPKAMSREAALILFQGVLLVSRTFLTGA